MQGSLKIKRQLETLLDHSTWITDAIPCMQGTALYPLQSCLNHSSNPNAETTKEDSDMDGQAVISAAHDIPAGTEVCISYIDLGAPEAEQQAALRDYGIPF
jgi:hypothetical protein